MFLGFWMSMGHGCFGSLWMFMGIYECLWVSMRLWVFMGFWASMDFWVSVYGYLSVSMDILFEH